MRPVGARIDAPYRPAPAALVPVIADQAVAQGLVGGNLQPRIEAGADREPALVQRLLAIAGQQLAAHFLGKIRRADDLGLLASAQRQCFGFGLDGLGLGRVAVLGHAIEHPVPARFGRLWKPRRVVVVGRLRQAGEIGCLAERQLIERLVEIGQRRGGDPIGAGTEIDLVEIQFENAILRQGLVDPGGE